MDSKWVLRVMAETSQMDAKLKASLRVLQQFNEQAAQSGMGINAMQKSNIEFAKQLGSISTSARTAQGSIKQLTTVLNEMENTYAKLSKTDKATAFGKNMAASIEQLRTRIRALNTEMARMPTGGNFMGGFGAIFAGNLAARGVMNTLRMFRDGIRDAINTNKEFEQANANLAAVLGTTRSEITALTNNAKKLGATTVYTAGQITELQTVLARRGFSEGQILQMTKGISSLATATQTDLSAAAEIAGSTMQAFGLNASQMDDIVATLGVSTTKSALSMEKLKTSLAYVAPAAKAAGFTLEDTVAMLGALSDAGLPATTAGVAVRNILVHLSTESSKLSKAIGHPVRSLDEFVDAMNELKNKGGNNLEYISSLVEKRVIPGFSVFMSNADKLKELRGEITDVRDELQGMVDEQINTLQGSATLLSSAWDGLMLSFSNSTGTLKKVTDYLTDLINAWTAARNLSMGGNAAINQRKQGGNADIAAKDVASARARFKDDDKARAFFTKERTSLQDSYNDIFALYTKYQQAVEEENIELMRKLMTELEGKGIGFSKEVNGKTPRKWMERWLAGVSDEIETTDLALGMLEGVKNTTTYGLEGGDGKPKGTKKKTPAEKAAEHIASAQERYSEAIEIAGQRLKSGLDNEEQYGRKMLSAEESLYTAFAQASYMVGGTNEEYKQGMADCIAAINGYGRVISDNEQLEKQRKEQLAAQTRLDSKILKGVMNGISPAGSKINGDEEDLMSYFGLSGIATKIADGTDISEADWTKLEDEINKKLQELKIAPIQIDLETGKVFRMNNEAKEMSKAWQQASSAVNTVGSALASLDNPMAKVAGTIAQAIANVALGAGKAISAKDTTASGWAWIGAAATITAEMIGTIAAIKSAVEYHADGGFVGASSLRRGTDTVPAMLTPGELVLSASQQSNLSRQLSQGGLGNLHLEKVIGAEEIRLILTNNNRRRRRAGTMSI